MALCGVLAGLGVGCSKEVASMPANAPTPEQEVLPPPPRSTGPGEPGPKQRPPVKFNR
jgi:hypothetical protein